MGKNILYLFTDDILLFLSNLAGSILNLIKQIDKFRQFSGYEISYTIPSVLYLNQEKENLQ